MELLRLAQNAASLQAAPEDAPLRNRMAAGRPTGIFFWLEPRRCSASRKWSSGFFSFLFCWHLD